MSPTENSIYCMQTSFFFPTNMPAEKKKKHKTKHLYKLLLENVFRQSCDGIGNSYFTNTLNIMQILGGEGGGVSPQNCFNKL